ncbi:MAG: hypothetical protein CMP23_07930 [Rickettsiales bacterium]|nr:hypothetical protein [Rickettsiales bacterium]
MKGGEYTCGSACQALVDRQESPAEQCPMRIRPLMVALFVLIGLSFWVQREPWQASQSSTDPGALVLPEFGSAACLSLQLSDGATQLVIQRESASEAQWFIEGEDLLRASEAHVQGALRALEGLRSRRRFESAGALDQYGFNDLSPRILWRFADGTQGGLQLGASSPTSGSRYVRGEGSKTIQLVAEDQLYPLLRDAIDYRDLSVLPVAPSSFVALTVVGPDELVLEFERNANGQMITKTQQSGSVESERSAPVETQAAAKLEDLLAQLVSMRGTRLGEESEGPLRPERAAWRVTLQRKGGGKAQLLFGGLDPEGGRYVRAVGDALPRGLGNEVLVVAADPVPSLVELAATRELEP